MHLRDAAPQTTQRRATPRLARVGDIDVEDAQRIRLHINEPGQRSQKCGFPGPVVADDGDALARGNSQTHVPQQHLRANADAQTVHHNDGGDR
jgi:hypothetical protein